jgi:uncharacterized protein DUF3800
MLPAFLCRQENEYVPSIFETMRLVYFDEAGSSFNVDQEPIITVAAVIVHGDLQTLPIEKDAREIVDDLVPPRLRDGFEFHGTHMLRNSGPIRGWPRAERYEALRAFLGLTRKHNLPVIAISLHKRGCRAAIGERFDELSRERQKHYAHEGAFLLCAASVEEWFRKNAMYERGFCIADDAQSRGVLRGGLGAYRRGWLTLDGKSIFSADHLIDTIYFGNSHESIFLQLADVCAFVIKRTAMKRTDVAEFYDVIRPQLMNNAHFICHDPDGLVVPLE